MAKKSIEEQFLEARAKVVAQIRTDPTLWLSPVAEAAIAAFEEKPLISREDVLAKLEAMRTSAGVYDGARLEAAIERLRNHLALHRHEDG